MDQLTKPTTRRLALWLVLSFLWFLFLVQALAMQPIGETYVPGAIFWAIVQGWLGWMAWSTWRQRREAA